MYADNDMERPRKRSRGRSRPMRRASLGMVGLLLGGIACDEAAAQNASGYVGDFSFSNASESSASAPAPDLTATSGTTVLTGTHTYSQVNIGAGATVVNNGTTADDLNNAGSFSNNAVYTANVASNTGTITNTTTGTWNGDINVGANTATGRVINQRTWSGTWSNSGGSLDNQNTMTGEVSNASGSFTNEGTVGAGLTNNGTATNNGVISGAVNNASIFVNSATGSVVGALTNTGTATNNGLLSGGVVQGGAFTNNASGVVDGGLSNGKGPTTNGGVINGGVDVSAGSVTNNATISGGVVLQGPTAVLANNATINGAVQNQSPTSQFVNNAGATVNGALTNAGATTNSGTIVGLTTNTGDLTNQGHGWLEAGLTSTAGSVVSDASLTGATSISGGTLTNNGTVSALTISGTGSVTNNDIILGATANSATLVNNSSGFLEGALKNAVGGVATNSGSIDGGVSNSGTFTNNAAGTVALGLTNSAGLTSNAGAISGGAVVTGGLLTTSGTIVGGLTNSGIVDATGAITGVITNTGTLAIGDGTAKLGQTLTIGAGSTVTGVISIPVDLSAGKIDFLSATGANLTAAKANLTGVLTNPGNAYWGSLAYSHVPLTLTPASLAALTALSSPLYAYTDPTGEKLVQTINPGLAATALNHASAMLTAMDTAFFGNPGDFLRAPADPAPNLMSAAVWSRGGGADMTLDASSTAGSAPAFNAAQFNTRIAGFQNGIEEGLFNIENSGLSLHVGLTGGEVFGSTSDANLQGATGKTTAPFLGGYAALTGNGLYSVFQARYTQLDMTINEPALGVVNQTQRAQGMTYSGEAGYHVAVMDEFYIEPSAALYLSRLEVGNEATNVGALTFGQLQDELGRLSLRVGTVFSTAQVTFSPYVLGSLWRALDGGGVTYIPGGPAITQSNVGMFEQASVGFSATIAKTGLTAYAQGDFRVGADVHGWGATGGLRYSF